jgi:hypothetical protein
MIASSKVAACDSFREGRIGITDTSDLEISQKTTQLARIMEKCVPLLAQARP